MTNWTRPSAVAGRFYPDSEEKIRMMLDSYMPPTEHLVSPLGLMAPHAGYIYSGRIAGEVYRRITPPKQAVLICPNHTGMGSPISTWSEGSWETPLGSVPIAQSLAADWLARLGVEGDRDAHQFEHAIETHVPFLQYLNPDISILPIVLGPLGMAATLDLGKELAGLVQSQKEPPLLIASTDMSHFLPADEAKIKDQMALDCVTELDPKKLYETVTREEISMCGFIPTAVVMEACLLLGATKGQLLEYGNSGEATGDLQSVVAYAAGWFLRG